MEEYAIIQRKEKKIKQNQMSWERLITVKHFKQIVFCLFVICFLAVAVLLVISNVYDWDSSAKLIINILFIVVLLVNAIISTIRIRNKKVNKNK